MYSFSIQHKLFNIFSSENLLFAESKDHSGNSFLTIIDVFSYKFFLFEKKLTLPPAVFMKSVLNKKIYFAECQQPDLPEVSCYHAFDFEGNFLQTSLKEEFKKEIFVEKEIFKQESDFFFETIALLSKNPALIQNDIYYLESQHIAAVLLTENENLTLHILGKNLKKELILKKNVRFKVQNVHFRLYEQFIFVFLEELSEIFIISIKEP